MYRFPYDNGYITSGGGGDTRDREGEVTPTFGISFYVHRRGPVLN